MADFKFKTAEDLDLRSRIILETTDVPATQAVKEIRLEDLDSELANKLRAKDQLDTAISELQAKIASIEEAVR